MRYMIDTNTLIYFFKGHKSVVQQFLQTAPQEIGIPMIVVYELEVGLAKSNSPEKRRQQLTALLNTVQAIPFGEVEARQAARIRAQLESQGQSIGPYDILIAATAVAHGSTLVTRNQKEFARVEGLSLTNWYSEA